MYETPGQMERKMLSLEELRQSKINSLVAKESYLQAEKRLSDVLDTKKSVEQKASNLFSAYVTVALALFGIGGAIFKDQGLSHKTWPFFIAGAFFVLGALIFMAAIKDEEYGFLGSPPNMWLNKGTIDGDNNALDAMFAYLAFHHARRIEVSANSNKRKIFAVRVGMGIGIAATIIFAVCFFAVT
jgi:hypothetical protein